jgi:hypothetical protein
MDRQFLEFWGNFLIHAAKGKKQLEDMTQWMQQGYKGFDELTAMFKSFYGLDKKAKSAPNAAASWQNAAENFQRSFKDYLRLMGLVTKEEHLRLVKKYETLKEKAAEQEETIRHLRMLLEEKQDKSQKDLAEGLQSLMEKQTRQFQRTMEAFGKSFNDKE